MYEQLYAEWRYLFCFLPYPNLKKTDEIYDGIPQYLADFKADEREMTKYIIGTISDMDTPMNPSAKGARSMTAYLQGLDFADIQKERDQVIGATDEISVA